MKDEIKDIVDKYKEKDTSKGYYYKWSCLFINILLQSLSYFKLLEMHPF